MTSWYIKHWQFAIGRVFESRRFILSRYIGEFQSVYTIGWLRLGIVLIHHYGG